MAADADAASPVERAGVGTSALVLVLVLLLVVTAVVNNVSSKLAYDAFGQRYSFWVNQASNIVYLVIASIGVVWTLIRRPGQIKWSMLKPKNLRPLLVMGSLDALSGFLAAMGSVGTPGPMIVILNQLLVPVTMLVSWVVLKYKYTWQEAAAAGVICGGAGLAVGPGALQGGGTAIAMLLYAVSNLPNAMSSVYKEKELKNALPLFLLTAMVALFQTLFTFCLLPVQALPGFGGVKMDQVGPLLWEGTLCFAGINSHPGDQCDTHRPAIFFSVYVGANFFYNVLALLISMSGSATLASISYTLQLPATSVIFALCGFMKLLAETCVPFTVYSALGMSLVLVGFVLHSLAERRAQLAAAEAAAAAAVGDDGDEGEISGDSSDAGFTDDDGAASVSSRSTVGGLALNNDPGAPLLLTPSQARRREAASDRLRTRWVQTALDRGGAAAGGGTGGAGGAWRPSSRASSSSSSLLRGSSDRFASNSDAFFYFSKLSDFSAGGAAPIGAPPPGLARRTRSERRDAEDGVGSAPG